MSSQSRAERRRTARAEKKMKRLSRNVVLRHQLGFYGEFRQSRKSLEHQNRQ